MRSRWLHHVASRVTLTFVACAIVPLIGLAVLTVRRTTEQLNVQGARRLHYDVKAVGVEALGRLTLWSNTLQVMASTIAAGSADPSWYASRLDQLFPHRPSAVLSVPDDGASLDLRGSLTVPSLSAAEREHLNRAGVLLVRGSSGADTPLHLLMVRAETSGTGVTVAMSVDYGGLFGFDQFDPLPPSSEICVFSQGAELLCSSGVAADVRRQAGAAEPGAGLVANGPDGLLLVRTRTIPMRATYGAEPWTVAMIRPQAVVLEPLARFRRDFWLVVILAACAVSWLSLRQIRRQLRPLAALTTATRRLSRRDFAHQVEISSGDEFEELGRAFNQLSADLKQQFDEVEAFALGTLEALARTIDAKSSWTGGHSQRVTRLAVELATQLGLPDDEVNDLRRGGLIHDIGKLATPPGILDKEGRLTPEENEIVQKHVLQGVHILEPIGAFQRLLPIVAQHHERWDGSGYPHGLAGEEIARSARILAVADACDAMHCDRPYRKGLSLADVVRRIKDGAGSHFDPAVAAAFVQVAEGGALAAGPVQGDREPTTVG